MNVFGFPSKLAALQFEWAWQHPYKARHLKITHGDPKAGFGRKTTQMHLKHRVAAVRAMLSTSPYNTWPLRVKLYTPEVAKVWETLESEGPPLSRGFEMTLEFEGVDAKSGLPGSGRTGPIDVMDTHFTAQHLQKYDALRESHEDHACSVCNGPIDIGDSKDPTTTLLCTHDGCTALSHLQCLASDFLSQQPSPSTSESIVPMVPRGGECPSCRKWTLWGDLIRGSYRRKKGAIDAVAAEALEMSNEERDIDESDGEPDSEGSEVIEGLANLKITQASPKRKKRDSSQESTRSDSRSRKPKSKARHASPSPSPSKPPTSKGKKRADVTVDGHPRGSKGKTPKAAAAPMTTKATKTTRKPAVPSPRPRGRPKKVTVRKDPTSSGSDVSLEMIDLDGVLVAAIRNAYAGANKHRGR